MNSSDPVISPPICACIVGCAMSCPCADVYGNRPHAKGVQLQGCCPQGVAGERPRSRSWACHKRLACARESAPPHTPYLTPREASTRLPRRDPTAEARHPVDACAPPFRFGHHTMRRRPHQRRTMCRETPAGRLAWPAEVAIDLGDGAAIVDDMYAARCINSSPSVLDLLTIRDTGPFLPTTDRSGLPTPRHVTGRSTILRSDSRARC
jgi:hypothetical protein